MLATLFNSFPLWINVLKQIRKKSVVWVMRSKTNSLLRA